VLVEFPVHSPSVHIPVGFSSTGPVVQSRRGDVDRALGTRHARSRATHLVVVVQAAEEVVVTLLLKGRGKQLRLVTVDRTMRLATEGERRRAAGGAREGAGWRGGGGWIVARAAWTMVVDRAALLVRQWPQVARREARPSGW